MRSTRLGARATTLSRVHPCSLGVQSLVGGREATDTQRMGGSHSQRGTGTSLTFRSLGGLPRRDDTWSTERFWGSGQAKERREGAGGKKV